MPDVIAGIDEAGRGPLAGPVVAAAVVLDDNAPIVGVADSKALSVKRRAHLARVVMSQARAWAIRAADVDEIDRYNILGATLRAMRRALEALPISVDKALVDGNRTPNVDCAVEAIVKGDRKVPAISAASILAKVHRDELMTELATHFPGYGFAQHKGYPTPEHLNALRRLGPCQLHRRSFAPVRALLAHSQRQLV